MNHPFGTLFCLWFLSACGTSGQSADAPPIDAPLPQGTLSLSWTLSDGVDALACADVAARTVRVVATPTAGGAALSDSLPCDNGAATTIGFPSGRYNVTVTLRAAAGDLSPPQRFNNVAIQSGTDVPLGALEFVVLPRGGFSVHVDASANGGNCDAPPGAEIVDVRLQLLDANSACVATSFTIGDGADQTGGTYVVSTCQEAWNACIENDQLLTVVDVPVGTYSLVAVGVEEDANGIRRDCYFGGGAITVPGGGLVDDQGTITIAFDANNVDCSPP